MNEVKKNRSNPGGAKSSRPPKKPGIDSERNRLIALFLIPLIFFIILQLFVFPNLDIRQISYSEFFQLVNQNPQTQDIVSAEMVEDIIRGKLKPAPIFRYMFRPMIRN